jgi:hypothetical protein
MIHFFDGKEINSVTLRYAFTAKPRWGGKAEERQNLAFILLNDYGRRHGMSDEAAEIGADALMRPFAEQFPKDIAPQDTLFIEEHKIEDWLHVMRIFAAELCTLVGFTGKETAMETHPLGEALAKALIERTGSKMEYVFDDQQVVQEDGDLKQLVNVGTFYQMHEDGHAIEDAVALTTLAFGLAAATPWRKTSDDEARPRNVRARASGSGGKIPSYCKEAKDVTRARRHVG